VWLLANPPMTHMSGVPTRQAQAVNLLPLRKRTFYGHAKIREQKTKDHRESVFPGLVVTSDHSEGCVHSALDLLVPLSWFFHVCVPYTITNIGLFFKWTHFSFT